MFASVSPASYRAIIDGQSCWGILPLLLARSILWPLGCDPGALVFAFREPRPTPAKTHDIKLVGYSDDSARRSSEANTSTATRARSLCDNSGRRVTGEGDLFVFEK